MVYRSDNLCEVCRELPAHVGCPRCQRPVCDLHRPRAGARCDPCEEEYAGRGRDKSGTWVVGFVVLAQIAPLVAAHHERAGLAALLFLSPMLLPAVLAITPDARSAFLRERVGRPPS